MTSVKLKNLAVLLLVVVLLYSLYYLGNVIQGSEEFNKVYLWLFGASVIAVLILAVIIIQRLVWLFLRRKNNEAGIQLTTRMVTTFIALSLPPVLIVYLFSTQFLNNYIDSWFNSKTQQALDDSLTLGQIYLDNQTRQALNETRLIAEKLSDIDEPRQAIYLDRFLEETQANSLSLISASGNLLHKSSLELLDITSDLPSQSSFTEVRSGGSFARIEPKEGIQLQIRTLVRVDNLLNINRSNRFLQGLFIIESQYSELASNIEFASVRYNQQSYQRNHLKRTFNIILTLVLLMSMLLALLKAFSSARKLVAPVRMLSKATESIAEGDFNQKIPVSSNDEIGFLVKSFNKMSSQLASSSAVAHRAQTDAESKKWYLESVLSHLSSGVLSVDNDQRVLMANSAASKILNIDSKALLNQSVDYLGLKNEGLIPFVELIMTKLSDHTEDWQQEILISENESRRILVVRGSRIPENEQDQGGLVVVFDDETIINQAQRDAAWSEVARRLAHEVKNPLTPIQLSAERLRLRFLNKLSAEDRDVMDRATQTIVSQVENLKTLVNAFSDYAKAPELKREPGGLNKLINEVVDLYLISNPSINFSVQLLQPEPTIFIDKGRFTQLFNNLIKNSQESSTKKELNIVIESKIHPDNQHLLQLTFADNGSGFKPDILKNVFEPYETTKRTGSGLGLAIVKKIVEEHGGSIKAYNKADSQGAIIEAILPIFKST